ncbi:hypothetical protein [Winogradskyella sp.]|uniref:hypothetical protein n=1 Tax=Winogradskyella sp. TaxID=1883156 RepID=UPI003BAB1CB5
MVVRGDILEASNRNYDTGLHYIIFYAGKDLRHFLGVMLTSSNDYEENISMHESYFEKKDLDNRDYKIQYQNSHIVPAKLMKLESWGPFEIVGKLTPEGVGFIESHIDHLDEMLWEEYLTSRG